jgi:asparagine synthase (glutamine-hydrolysing)
MCGICGILGNAGSVADARQAVSRMMELLAHRGPDGEGLVETPGAVLGHRRLAIIDLEHGAQPMASPDGRHVLVFNGEIYNYIELRNALTAAGVAFRTASDTEVLLQMLIRHGPAALSQLNGMFAFAFVDRQTGEWLIARDPFGIKPLYYAQLDGAIAFASEIKALFVHPGIRPEPDWAGLQEYLTFQFCLYDKTLFKGVKKVEPGCYVAGSGGAIRKIERYWDTRYEVDEDHTESYFIERLRALIEDSGRLQIRADVPLGAHLSGGLDSSAVAAAARRRRAAPVKAFHGRFADGPQYDESGYARTAAQGTGCELIETVITPAQFVEDLPRLVRAMDEPAAGPGLFPQYRVSRLAREHVKVVLGGQGGDEIFGGYARYLIGYLEQALKGAIFETQEEGRHVVTLSSIIPNLPVLQEYRPLLQHFWRDGLFDDMDARYFRLIDRSPDLEHLLSGDARARFDRQAVFGEFRRLFNHPGTLSYVNKMTHFDIKTLLPALLHIEDRVSMAVSLESRVPLLDTRIVDLVTSMPPQVKFHGGRTKHVFRNAIAGLIPDAILNRKDKMGFPVPLSEWVRRSPVRDFVCDVLLDRRSRERGLFDPRALEGLIGAEAAFGRQLWGVLCLELWHREFIDRP